MKLESGLVKGGRLRRTYFDFSFMLDFQPMVPRRNYICSVIGNNYRYIDIGRLLTTPQGARQSADIYSKL